MIDRQAKRIVPLLLLIGTNYCSINVHSKDSSSFPYVGSTDKTNIVKQATQKIYAESIKGYSYSNSNTDSQQQASLVKSIEEALKAAQTNVNDGIRLLATPLEFLNNYSFPDERVARLNITMAELLQNSGRVSESEQYILKARFIALTIYGYKHPFAIRTQNSVAWLHFLQGRFEDARKEFGELDLNAKTLEEIDPMLVLIIKLNMSLLYEGMPKEKQILADAEVLINSQAALKSKITNPTEWAKAYLALYGTKTRIYHQSSEFRKAKLLLNEALKQTVSILGEENPQVIHFMGELAIINLKLGDTMEAIDLGK